MKKTRTVNGFDSIFEAIYNSITKTKNYNLVLECPDSVELLSFFLQRLLDINNYYNLYKHSFIPAANKSVVVTKNQYTKSKYKSLINVTQLDLQENLYETIRLGYVGLAHKIEGFTKGIKQNDLLIRRAYEIEDDFSIEENIKSRFGVDFFNPICIPRLNKIRIISNAVKHNNGYPQLPDKEKDDLSKLIPFQDMKSKINIAPELFLLDIKVTIGYFNAVNDIVHIFSMLYLLETKEIGNDDFEAKKSIAIDNYRKLIGLYTQPIS